MAVFKFRLAPVLRWREHHKNDRRWELRALNEERRGMEDEIEALEEELASAGHALAGREGQLFSAIDLRLLGEYAQLIAGRIRDRKGALEKLTEQLLAKRVELVEAMRAVKSLEQLRKREADQFDYEQDLAARKFADEVAQRKFVIGAGRKKIPDSAADAGRRAVRPALA